MLLLWGSWTDLNVAEVASALTESGSHWLWLDVSGIRANCKVCPGLRERKWLEDVTGVLVRPGESAPAHIKQVSSGYIDLAQDLWTWLDECDAKVFNRPKYSSSNESKPRQGLVIDSVGFRFP